MYYKTSSLYIHVIKDWQQEQIQQSRWRHSLQMEIYLIWCQQVQLESQEQNAGVRGSTAKQMPP